MFVDGHYRYAKRLLNECKSAMIECVAAGATIRNFWFLLIEKLIGN